jgi:hypothetical protein
MKAQERSDDAIVSPSQLVCELAEASKALRCVLDWEEPSQSSSADGKHKIATRQALNVAELNCAFAAVKRLAGLLESPADVPAPQTLAALSEYQALLREFKSRLPYFHELLLIERARVLARQSHSDALGDWAEINRQTR